MSTIVAFHAHPDDEAIATGGTLARAVAEGHRAIVVTATDGSRGEVADGFLRPGQTLGEVRAAELLEAGRILGVENIQLGYRDSGMMGSPDNADPATFWQVDIDAAARRVAAILTEVRADVLTVYDDHGGYGHPDHIQVHRVGHRAARLAGTSRVFEATMNRDRIRRMRATAADTEMSTAARRDDPELENVGTPDAAITTAIDVRDWLKVKRKAMEAHASQINDDSWFLKLPPEVFTLAFGTEWLIRTTPEFTGSIPADRESWLWP